MSKPDPKITAAAKRVIEAGLPIAEAVAELNAQFAKPESLGAAVIIPHNVPEDKGKDTAATAAQFGLLRAWCAIHGFTQAQVNEAIGQNTSNRSNGQIAEELRVWIKANA